MRGQVVQQRRIIQNPFNLIIFNLKIRSIWQEVEVEVVESAKVSFVLESFDFFELSGRGGLFALERVIGDWIDLKIGLGKGMEWSRGLED